GARGPQRPPLAASAAGRRTVRRVHHLRVGRARGLGDDRGRFRGPGDDVHAGDRRRVPGRSGAGAARRPPPRAAGRAAPRRRGGGRVGAGGRLGGLLLVGIGGGLGSAVRLGVRELGLRLVAVEGREHLSDEVRPGTTVVANILACFLLGIVVARL